MNIIAEKIIESVYNKKQKVFNCKDSSINTTLKIKGYYEPFCDMLNVYKYIPDLINKYINTNHFTHINTKIIYKASDLNPNIIRLWNGLKNDSITLPTSCTLIEYNNLIETNTLKSIFIGYACSQNNKFKSKYDNDLHMVDYKNEIISISNKLKLVDFKLGNYDMYTNILKGYIIYCKPPINNMFDFDKFLEWCTHMNKKNFVFIHYNSHIFDNRVELIWEDMDNILYMLL